MSPADVVPTVVAESLVPVQDLLRASVPTPIAGEVPRVVAGMVAPLAPAAAPDPPPPWLWPAQHASFARVLGALDRHGGALLADPVGAGKTWVALAVAAARGGSSTDIVAPAALRDQWEATAARAGIAIRCLTHERASRGPLPGGRGLVIVDESHRFRDPATRRHAHLARAVVGRPVLLLTATPAVNRVADLVHQLRLAVADDVLAFAGVPSLAQLATADAAPEALGALVIVGTRAESLPRPVRQVATVASGEGDLAPLLRLLDSLVLSHRGPVAALVRLSLLAALASSPAAFVAAVRRYRTLLLHARDASEAGVGASRATLRTAIGHDPAQTVLWQMVGTTESTDLPLHDLGPLAELEALASARAERPDARCEQLRRHLADGTPSVVFTQSRATVRWLRDQLGTQRIAWCTGQRAGVGRLEMPRRRVLQLFGPAASDTGPRVLLASDVAAEGLDLQRAARVIHYDLPWTAARLEQREGRAVRAGSRWQSVEVLRFTVAPPLERRLRRWRAVVRKSRLGWRLGLDAGDRAHGWRLRAEIAERWGRGAGRGAGIARVHGVGTGLLAGFAILDAAGQPVDAGLLHWDGTATEERLERLAPLLEACARARASRPTTTEARRTVDRVVPLLRDRLAQAQRRHGLVGPTTPAVAQLNARAQALARTAARQRDAGTLARLEALLAFAGRAHRTGEVRLAAELARLPSPRLLAAAGTLPTAPPPRLASAVVLTGVLLLD